MLSTIWYNAIKKIDFPFMPSPYTKTRVWLSIITVLAFFIPLMTIVVVEYAKNASQIAASRKAYLSNLEVTNEERAKYYENIEAQRKTYIESMDAAKAQYETLLQDQPAQVKAHQTTKVETVNQPVVVQKKVTVPASTSSKPKSSRSTKTS